jgi:hypothetical protein
VGEGGASFAIILSGLLFVARCSWNILAM